MFSVLLCEFVEAGEDGCSILGLLAGDPELGGVEGLTRCFSMTMMFLGFFFFGGDCCNM